MNKKTNKHVHPEENSYKIDLIKNHFNGAMIVISKPITIKELAKLMAVKATLLCNYIIKLNLYTYVKDINHLLDIEHQQLILEDLCYKFKIKTTSTSIKDIIIKYHNESYSYLTKKPKIPVVSIMGHVDHGKTTLLDFIRSSHIKELEIGNITQKLGAYYVQTKKGYITFLDTPGHEIFNLMRVRGIQISDIIIIIIAANDGIKPQTIEVIQNALHFKLPIIVAINKIELVDKNVLQKITHELLNYKIIAESLGGDTFIIPISAKTGEGVNKLLETILLQRDVLELQYTEEGMVIGTVIESSVDKHLGPLASILIENGTLHKGDIVICGNSYGKIKNIRDEYLKYINVGYPSMPIQILGLSEPPIVGTKLITVATEKEAKEIIIYQKKYNTFNNLLISTPSNESKLNNITQINLIIKSDAYGSLEVLVNYFDYLNKQHKQQIYFKIIHKGIGYITENDVILAANTKSKLIGFNIGIYPHVKNHIRQRKIDVKIYNIIYQLMEYINLEFIDTIKQTYTTILGQAIVKHIYPCKEDNIILGCEIIEGCLKKDCIINISRSNKLVYKGTLKSLRRFKNDVTEVSAPMECGISINNLKNIQIGDIVQASINEYK